MTVIAGAIITTATVLNALRDIGSAVDPDAPSTTAGPPVAQDDSFNVNEDQTTDLDVLANDVNVGGGQTLVLNVVEEPSNGRITAASTEAVDYQPNTDFYGEDQFTYAVTGADGTRTTAVVRLTVQPVNDPPTINTEPIVASYPRNAVMLIALEDIASDTDGDALTLSSFELLGSDYAPERSDNMIGGSAAFVGTLPAARETWANNAIFINVDSWTRSIAQVPEGGRTATALRVTVTDAQGSSSTADIPIELRVGTIAGIIGRCTQTQGDELSRMSFTVRQNDQILSERTVSGDRLDDWIIGLAHETHYISDFSDVDLEASWRASDNPFTLECILALRSDGLDLEMSEQSIVGYTNRTEQSRSLFVSPRYQLGQMEGIFSRIYDRPVQILDN